ncbi:hypothetical protein D3C76_1547580 [compost metagenome]
MAEGTDASHHRTLVRQFVQVAVAQALVFATAGSGNHQHRHRISVSLAHGGENVGHAGPGDNEAHARFAAGAGITVGHEAGALLMAGAHVF